MSMEVRIGRAGEDCFDFPTEQKTGCKLFIKVEMGKTNVLSSEPEEKAAGGVLSRLESGEDRRRARSA